MDTITLHRLHLSQFLRTQYPEKESMKVNTLASVIHMLVKMPMEVAGKEENLPKFVRLTVDTFRVWFALPMNIEEVGILSSRVERFYRNCLSIKDVDGVYILFACCMLELKKLSDYSDEILASYLPFDTSLIRKLNRLEFMLLKHL